MGVKKDLLPKAVAGKIAETTRHRISFFEHLILVSMKHLQSIQTLEGRLVSLAYLTQKNGLLLLHLRYALPVEGQ